MTNEQKIQAFKLRMEGATYQTIADMFGCSKQYVYMVLHDKARKQIKCVYPGLKCYIEEHDGNSHRFWLGSDKRLIDANALMKNIGKIPQLRGITYGRMKKAVEETPTIDAVDVVHGRWIEHPDDRCSLFNGWECSECKQIVSGGRGNYCPNCGAKMDAKEEQQ